jgi:hypothetical protein
MTLQDCIADWIAKAEHHEGCVDELDHLHDPDNGNSTDEERLLHSECARVYRQCAAMARRATHG